MLCCIPSSVNSLILFRNTLVKTVNLALGIIVNKAGIKTYSTHLVLISVRSVGIRESRDSYIRLIDLMLD